MYNRSSYENMISELNRFASTVYLAQSEIQTSCSVMSRTMTDDNEANATREAINKLCLSIAELTNDAKSVARSLEEEMERIERETRQRMAEAGGSID